jgi:hypothetical protein
VRPQRYLADVLARIVDHPARQITDLWHWQPADLNRAAADALFRIGPIGSDGRLTRDAQQASALTKDS